MLTYGYEDILLVSALLAPLILTKIYPPPLADLTWCSICSLELTIPTNTQQHLLAARALKEDWYS